MVIAAAQARLTLGRRKFLTGLAAASVFAGPELAWADTPGGKRIVAFDWGLAATAIDLGARLIGVPSIDYYNLSTIEPALPADIVDVGLLFTPNFEILEELAPDLILIPPALKYAARLLERIAPTVVADIGGGILAKVRMETSRLAEGLGMKDRADKLTAITDEALRAASDSVAAWHDYPFYIASFADDRHLTAYGPGSLFDDLLNQLSLRNVMSGRSILGGRLVIGMEELARNPDAAILLLSDGGNNAVPSNSATGIFWRSLPAVQRGNVFGLAPVLDNGGLPAAIRFARLTSAALSRVTPRNG